MTIETRQEKTRTVWRSNT